MTVSVSVTKDHPFSGAARLDGRMGFDDQARRICFMSGIDPAAPLYCNPVDLAKPGARLYKGLKHDSAHAAFFARQLEYIYTQTFDARYPELKARDFVPVDTRVPSGAESFTYRSYDKTGYASILHSYAASSFPESDVVANEFTQKVVSLGAKYSFSIQDMRAAAMAGVPLEAKKADSARWAIESLLEDLAATGDNSTQTPLYGLANVPGMQNTTKLSTGTWATQVAAGISDSVTRAIVGDIQAMYNDILKNTKGIHKANTLLLAVTPYTVLSSTPRSTTFTTDTLLDYVKELLGPLGVTTIDYWGRLDTAGSGSTTRAIMFERSEANEGLIIPQEFEQFAPQPDGMRWVIPCHMRTGAVEGRYPKSMTYTDGF